MKRERKRIRKKQIYCKICHNNKGMIHKYGINLCRRCFKDIAENLGFKKYS